MHRFLHRWQSPHLEREMPILELGHAGIPVLVFPTAPGGHREFEDHGIVEVLRQKLEAGLLHLYCVESIDDESWFAPEKTPQERVQRHNDYETYLLQEVMPLIGAEQIGVTGCAAGGFHAVNFTLRHPDCVRHCVSLGGAYDLTGLMENYLEEDLYFHQPLMYLPSDDDGWYWERYQRLLLVLAVGEGDPCLHDNQRLSSILQQRSIPHWLDVWDDQAHPGWDTWRGMVQKYF